MGTFDSMKDKAQDMAGEHSDKIEEGMDKAGDFADEKTGGKHSDKIDKAMDKGRDVVGGAGNDQQ